MAVGGATPSRCLVVAVLLTAGSWGVFAWLVRALATGPGTGPAVGIEGGLVRLCLAVLALAAAWGWAAGLAAVMEAWRGTGQTRLPGAPSLVRRLVLAACGVALTGALVAPAAIAVDTRPRPDALHGLPLPERAEGPAHAPAHPPARRSVVVRTGDSLWSLAVADLPRHAPAYAVAQRSQLIYRLNHAAIGPDPDLIRSGQRLLLPHSPDR